MDFGAGALGQPREHHASLPSTNDRALAWAREGAPHGAMVTADAQTAGRGRLGRRWDSPPGAGLYVSLVLRPAEVVVGRGWDPRWAALGLAVGLGLREGLARWVPDALLKWPNDLLVRGHKLAGVLCETRWQGSTPDIVVGFGVNVAQREFPAELRATSLALELARRTCSVGPVGLAEGTGSGRGTGLSEATGLARGVRPSEATDLGRRLGLAEGTGPGGQVGLAEGTCPGGQDRLAEGTCPGREEVLAAALAGLGPALRAFFTGGFPAIRARYERHSAVLGRALTVGGAPAEAVGFDDDGALRVRAPGGGPSRRVESEDVWIRGPGEA